MTAPERGDALVHAVVALARRAGEAINELYTGGYRVDAKKDGSPLTTADRRSHQIIVQALGEMTPDVPVLSEESVPVSPEVRRQWSQFWMVDPLDGTREFVKGNGEFTVNIALVRDGIPVLGVVYAPVPDLMYWATQGGDAYRQRIAGEVEFIHTGEYSGGRARVAASRSHGRGALGTFLQALHGAEGDYDVVSMGSSLKICLVAEGGADVYPRLGPTWEWDTAAAHCILHSAGGRLIDRAGRELRYNKVSLLNPWFLAVGRGDYGWSRLLPEET